jgi:hypothetical protein
VHKKAPSTPFLPADERSGIGMLRNVASKLMWVGRTASMVFGLALVLALMFGVASMAFGANGDFFKIGRANLASAVSTLTRSGAGPALSLKVGSGAPLAVNSSTKVANLNADKVDGLEGASFVQGGGTVHHFGPVVMTPTSGSFVFQELVAVGPFHIKGHCGPINPSGSTSTHLLVDEAARPYSGGWQSPGQDRSYPSSTDPQLDLVRNISNSPNTMDPVTGSAVSLVGAHRQINFTLYQNRETDSSGNISCTFGGYVVEN